MVVRCRALFELLIAGAALTSCGTPTTPAAQRTTPAPSRAQSQHVPVLTGRVRTSEDVTLDTSFHAGVETAVSGADLTYPPATTCAAYAASAGGVFFAPEFDVTSADHSLFFSATATSYTGPGDYSSAGNGTITGTISVGVGVGTGQQTAYSIFRSQINGSSTMSVRPDGSGSFTFSEWGSDEVRGNSGSAANISGTLTWTCS